MNLVILLSAILISSFMGLIIYCIIRNSDKEKKLELILETWDLPEGKYSIYVDCFDEYHPQYLHENRWEHFEDKDGYYIRFTTEKKAIRYLKLADYLCSIGDPDIKRAMKKKYNKTNTRIEL